VFYGSGMHSLRGTDPSSPPSGPLAHYHGSKDPQYRNYRSHAAQQDTAWCLGWRVDDDG
jgi:hypothetical protein